MNARPFFSTPTPMFDHAGLTPEALTEAVFARASAPRSLPVIVADLATTKQRVACLDAALLHRDPTDVEDALWDTLTDRQHALEREARAAVLVATGVSADLIMEALS